MHVQVEDGRKVGAAHGAECEMNGRHAEMDGPAELLVQRLFGRRDVGRGRDRESMSDEDKSAVKTKRVLFDCVCENGCCVRL